MKVTGLWLTPGVTGWLSVRWGERATVGPVTGLHATLGAPLQSRSHWSPDGRLQESIGDAMRPEGGGDTPRGSSICAGYSGFPSGCEMFPSGFFYPMFVGQTAERQNELW